MEFPKIRLLQGLNNLRDLCSLLHFLSRFDGSSSGGQPELACK